MIFAAAVLSVAACQEPAGPRELVQPLGAASQSSDVACYSPGFHVDYTLVFPPTLPFTWEGVVSGDLVGTAVLVYDLENPVVIGTSNVIVVGTVSWDITGGVIPDLVGRQFQTRVRFLAVSTPDNEPAALNQSHEKALAGIRHADFTAHGGADGFPPVSRLDYQGVICP